MLGVELPEIDPRWSRQHGISQLAYLYRDAKMDGLRHSWADLLLQMYSWCSEQLL